MGNFSSLDDSSIDSSEQDKIINQLIFDADFINKCIRLELSKDLFLGEIRQSIVEYIYKYFEKYSEAPTDNIVDILSESSIIPIKIKEDDFELAIDYISRTIKIKNTEGKIKALYDKISSFKNKQIIYNTISRLNKMKDRIDGTEDKMQTVIKEADEQLSRSSLFATTESIFDSEGYSENQIITKFNIPAIDLAIGGGFIAPNLAIIQAFTGRGKTWSMTHLIKMAARLGNDCVVFETEMATVKFKNRMRMSLTGMSYSDLLRNLNEADATMKASMVANSEIHIVPEVKMGKNYSITALKSIIDEIQDRTGKEQALIFIDSPDDLDPPKEAYASNKIEKSQAVFTWLRNYSQTENKCLIVTCQSQRSAENLLWTTSGNIGDDINKVRRATIGISINAFKKECDAGYIRLLVFKNTHGPEMKACWIKTNYEIGQFIQEAGAIKGLNLTDYKQMLLNRGITL